MTWREGWEPEDPLRACFTCGAPPSHFFDRERSQPSYACTHEPYFTEDPPVPVWADRATQKEWDEAYKRARKIKEMNDERGWKSKYNQGDKQILYLARGIAAELVASRLTGLVHNKGYLSAGYRRSRKKADIGVNVEVRNTRDHHGDLALYDNDPDDRIALLVTGSDPFVLRGWIRVKHGRLRHLYRRTPAPDRWLVPQAMLLPMPLPSGA